MTFTVIGGGGAVDGGRNGNSGFGARVTGTLSVSPGQTVLLQPGSAGRRRDGIAQNETNAGGRAAPNSLTGSVNGGHGVGSASGGGGAGSVLSVDGQVVVIAGGGGGSSQSLSTGIGNPAKYFYNGGSTIWGARDVIPQGSGGAGLPTAAGVPAPGDRGEGAFLIVSEHGATFGYEQGALAMGVEGGAGGGADAGGTGGAIGTPYAWQGLTGTGTSTGNPGGRGYGGNANYQPQGGLPSAGGGGGGYFGGGGGSMTVGEMQLYPALGNTHGTGSGGGGGSSWVDESVSSFTSDRAPNGTANEQGGFGTHGMVEIVFTVTC